MYGCYTNYIYQRYSQFTLVHMQQNFEPPHQLTHLQRLEAESIHIMREVVATCDNPVMLYSIGKDSAVMLHLALKATQRIFKRFAVLD